MCIRDSHEDGGGELEDDGVGRRGHLVGDGEEDVGPTHRQSAQQDPACLLYTSYFVDHTAGVYPTAASGFPWSAGSIQSTGDVIADLTEDLAAEQKARLTYDNILRLSDDPDVNNVIRFLRERAIVHFPRFGECLRLCKATTNSKNVYLRCV